MEHQIYDIKIALSYLINYMTYWGIFLANSELMEEGC